MGSRLITNGGLPITCDDCTAKCAIRGGMGRGPCEKIELRHDLITPGPLTVLYVPNQPPMVTITWQHEGDHEQE